VLIDIRRTAPALFPVIRYWEASAVKDILKPSGYFGLITICTFLTYQAPLIVLQRLLGPVAVAGFIVMRLVFSMCRQVLAMFTQSIGAEITNLFARNDWPGLARLYDYSERLVFFMIPIVNTGVLLLSPLLITVWMHKRAELFSPYPYVLSAAISMVISLKEHKYQFQFSTNTHEALARNMFFSYLAMVAISICVIPIAGIVGFLWLWLAIESIQVVRIVRLNLELFAGHDAVEFHYMRRLVGICAPALLISLLILQRSASYPLLLQLGISIAAGLGIAGLSWRLFGMNTVLKKMSGTLSRKFA
jgi:O-antigen/teichoic acid export membrane protein